MKKQGQLKLSHKVIIEIILIVAITTAFFYLHKTVQKNTLFEKSYAVRDIALLLETTQSTPGEIEIYYSQPIFDIGKYSYSFADNLLRIYEEDSNVAAIYYPFYLDTSLKNYLGTLEKPAAFVISKENNIFEVKEFGGISEQQDQKYICPAISSTKKNFISLVVVSYESRFAKIQADLLNNPKLGFAKEKRSDEASAINEKTSVVIVLSTEHGDAIKTSVPVGEDQQSEKLACLITNNIFENLRAGEPVASVPSSDVLLTTNTAGLAVHVVIGEELLSEGSAISSAIQSALEEYVHE